MRSTPDEIRRRIAKRKRSSGSVNGSPRKESNRLITWPGDEEKYGFNHTPSYETKFDEEGNHPLFKKEIFIFKILASALLFLAIAILFRNNAATFDPARDFVAKSMDTDFKFATVANWYEKNFGKPLALLPFPAKDKENEKSIVDKEGSIPVFSGKVLENFEKNGQGIMIETSNGANVEVMNEGFVKFAGVKEGLGKTVIIEHLDQSQSWYANLEEIKVNVYSYIEKETVVGTASVSAGEDKTKGKYYFAVKKGDDFIDPVQVIRFE